MSASGRDCKERKSLVMREEFLCAPADIQPFLVVTGRFANVRIFLRLKVFVTGRAVWGRVCSTKLAWRSLPSLISRVSDATTSSSITCCVGRTTSSWLLSKGLPNCSAIFTNDRTSFLYLRWKYLASSRWAVEGITLSSTASKSLTHLQQSGPAIIKSARASGFSYRPTAPPCAWRFVFDCSWMGLVLCWACEVISGQQSSP